MIKTSHPSPLGAYKTASPFMGSRYRTDHLPCWASSGCWHFYYYKFLCYAILGVSRRLAACCQITVLQDVTVNSTLNPFHFTARQMLLEDEWDPSQERENPYWLEHTIRLLPDRLRPAASNSYITALQPSAWDSAVVSFQKFLSRKYSLMDLFIGWNHTNPRIDNLSSRLVRSGNIHDAHHRSKKNQFILHDSEFCAVNFRFCTRAFCIIELAPLSFCNVL